MRLVKNLLLLFVTALSFLIFFTVSSLNHHENTLNQFKQNSFQVVLPINIDKNIGQNLSILQTLTNSKWRIIKEESNVANSTTTFYTFSNTKLNNELNKIPNGTIEHDFNGTILKESFSTLPKDDLLSGLFYIKPSSNLSTSQVKSILEKRLHTRQIGIRRYKKNTKAIHDPNQLQLKLFLSLSVLLLILSYIYDYFLSYKELGLMLLSGYSKWTILKSKFHKNISILWESAFLVLLLAACWILVFKYIHFIWIIQTSITVLAFVIFAYFIAFLLFTLLLTFFEPKATYLKGDYPAKLIWKLNMGIKCVLMITLVLVSQNIVPQVKNTLNTLETHHETAIILSGYKNTPLMPSQRVNQYEDQHPSKHIKESQKLFERLYSKKLLLFSPSDETRNKLIEKGKTSPNSIEKNFVWVSPEYLKQVPIYDESGKQVVVKDNAKNGTILIPRSRLYQKKRITESMEKHYIEDAFSLGRSLISSKSAYKENNLPSLKYMTIQDNPKLLTFYDYYAGINNPIIMVIPKYLVSLPYAVYADDIAGSSDDFFFKDSQKSAHSLIKKSGLDADFPKPIAADRFVETYLQDAITTSFIEGSLGLILIISFVTMSLFSIKSFLINQHRQLFLKKVMGYRFLDIIGIYLTMIIIFWFSISGYEILIHNLDIANFCFFIGCIDLLISSLSAKKTLNQLGGNLSWK